MQIKSESWRQVIMLLITVIICVVAWKAWYLEPVFDAERLLAQSKLKERTFKGEVCEVSALNGKVSAYLMEEHSVPLVAVTFRFARAGSAYEIKPGMALMMESVLLDGAGSFSRRELREIMKEKGIRLQVSAGIDNLIFSLSYVKDFEKEAMDVLRAVMYVPQLKREDMMLARRQLAMLRQQQEEKPGYQLARLVRREFYGEHPYGKAPVPDDKVLGAVSATDIRAYLKAVMGKDNLTVGIAGDMDKAEVEAFLSRVFGDLPDEAQVGGLMEFKPNFNRELAVEVSPVSAQSFVMAVTQGISRSDKDFYPLYVADYIFGGAGLSSRLSRAVREKEGLTYGVYSAFTVSDAINLWQVEFSATPENVDKIMEIVATEYQAFYDNGVSSEELARAKKSLLASFNLRFNSLLNIADMLERMQYWQLGKDFLKQRQALVAAVTVEAVNSAVRRRMPKSFDAAGGVRIFEVHGGLKAGR